MPANPTIAMLNTVAKTLIALAEKHSVGLEGYRIEEDDITFSSLVLTCVFYVGAAADKERFTVTTKFSKMIPPEMIGDGIGRNIDALLQENLRPLH